MTFTITKFTSEDKSGIACAHGTWNTHSSPAPCRGDPYASAMAILRQCRVACAGGNHPQRPGLQTLTKALKIRGSEAPAAGRREQSTRPRHLSACPGQAHPASLKGRRCVGRARRNERQLRGRARALLSQRAPRENRVRLPLMTSAVLCCSCHTGAVSRRAESALLDRAARCMREGHFAGHRPFCRDVCQLR